MANNHPSMFYQELTNVRLTVIAEKLLDVRHTTIREMSSEFDDNYTRETAVFGRSRNMLISLSRGNNYDWLSLSNAGMDITFNIERVPCRFFRDDPDSPEKLGFFKRNAVDDLFETDENFPVMWRFIVEKALTENDEDRVFFTGYNVFQEKIAEWMYSTSTPLMHAVDQEVPAAAEIPPADIGLRDDQSDSMTGNGE